MWPVCFQKSSWWGCKLCPVIHSVHSSHSHLCLCLAGSSCSLGFPHVEKQQGYEHRFLFLSGDCVRLWLFALHLYPHSSKYHITEQTLNDILVTRESAAKNLARCCVQPNTHVLSTVPFECKVNGAMGATYLLGLQPWKHLPQSTCWRVFSLQLALETRCMLGPNY